MSRGKMIFFFVGIGVVKLAGAAEGRLVRVVTLALVVELEVDCCCGGRSLAALVAVAAFAFAPPSSLERVHHYRREARLEAADAAFFFAREPDEAPVCFFDWWGWEEEGEEARGLVSKKEGGEEVGRGRKNLNLAAVEF